MTPGLIVSHVVSALLLALVVSCSLSSKGSPSEAMSFYAAFHQDPVNQLIHFIGVSLLVESSL